MTLQLEVNDELVSLLRQGDQGASESAKEMIVLELYRRGTISSGKAAEVLGMSRVGFIQHAGRLGIAHFNMDADEWESERAHSA